MDRKETFFGAPDGATFSNEDACHQHMDAASRRKARWMDEIRLDLARSFARRYFLSSPDAGDAQVEILAKDLAEMKDFGTGPNGIPSDACVALWRRYQEALKLVSE